MSIITVGIDLAKNVFAVHGVDDNGKPALVKPKVSREHLLPLIAQLPPCVIGMEACSGAHHWARQFRQHGHTVKLMAPKFVSPYRMSGKRGKNDAADAAAICEAVTRPAMRFVPVKEEHQQVILALHRTRTGFVEERTATYNRLRGVISEFGIVCPQKIANLRRALMDHLEDLPGYVNQCVGDLLAHADSLDARIAEYDRIIAKAARDDTRSKRLMSLPGIGPNTASAMLASAENVASCVKSGSSCAVAMDVAGPYWMAAQAPAPSTRSRMPGTSAVGLASDALSARRSASPGGASCCLGSQARKPRLW